MLLLHVLQLPLSLAYIGLVLNHWQVAHRIGKKARAACTHTPMPKKIGAPGDV
jgi:hypothetical protein